MALWASHAVVWPGGHHMVYGMAWPARHWVWHNMACRVRATDRHCRQMRRKNIFGTKKHHLAKTNGEKKSPLKTLAPKYHLIAN